MSGNRNIKTVAVSAFALAALIAATASAHSTTSISMTLHEPFQQQGSCFILNTQVCGSGEVVGLGQVSDLIRFGEGCGGACDRRTLTFADRSKLVLDETANPCGVPGRSYRQPVTSDGQPFSCTLSDTVDALDSTGRYAGVTGNLLGEVNVAGRLATIKLAGSITLP